MHLVYRALIWSNYMTVKRAFTSRKWRSISLIHFEGAFNVNRALAKKASSSKWVNTGFLNDALLHTLPLDSVLVLNWGGKSSWRPCWGNRLTSATLSARTLHTYLFAKPWNICTALGTQWEAFSQKGEKKESAHILTHVNCRGVWRWADCWGTCWGENMFGVQVFWNWRTTKKIFFRQQMWNVLNSIYTEAAFLYTLFRDHVRIMVVYCHANMVYYNLQEFLKSEVSVENILFWQACENFRKIPASNTEKVR